MRNGKDFPKVLGLLLGLFVAVAGAQGPVGHWPLDGNGLDISGNNLHGALNGVVQATADRNGNTTGALQFGGGNNDYVNVPDATTSPLRISGAITLAAWAYYTSPTALAANNMRILSRNGPANNRGWDLNIESGGRPANIKQGAFMVAVAPNTLVSVGTTDPLTRSYLSIPFNQWFHLAGVFRPGERVEIYLNGQLNNTQATTYTTQWVSTTLPVRIGNRASGTNQGWVGYVDDARVYNRALSSAEIAALATTIVPAPSTPTLTSAQAGDGEVRLDWSPVSGNVSGYHVYQSQASGGPYTQVSTATVPTATVTGLTNGTIYYFVVTAFNAGGDSGYSNEMSATPQFGISAGTRRWPLYDRRE